MATDLIAPLHPAALDAAAMTLERAFARDPMFTWMFPNPRERSQALRAMNRVPLRYGLRYGYVTGADQARAIAVWMPPGRTITIAGMMRCGMLGMPFAIGLRAFVQFMGANDALQQFHTAHVPEPHWYLLIVGVDPELQGRGLGSALIRDGLARADEARQPCYLETSDERNLAFYERFGFAVVGTAPLGKGGPPGWAMRRDVDRAATSR